jgi:hypothetical protein
MLAYFGMTNEQLNNLSEIMDTHYTSSITAGKKDPKLGTMLTPALESISRGSLVYMKVPELGKNKNLLTHVAYLTQEDASKTVGKIFFLTLSVPLTTTYYIGCAGGKFWSPNRDQSPLPLTPDNLFTTFAEDGPSKVFWSNMKCSLGYLRIQVGSNKPNSFDIVEFAMQLQAIKSPDWFTPTTPPDQQEQKEE